MSLSSNYFFIVDIIVVVIFILCMAFSYKNGLIYELVSLLLIFISLFFAYLLSPILAKRYYLIKPDLSSFPDINPTVIYNGVNVVVWFIVLVILFCLILILIKPLFKKLTKIPVIGWVNKVFGVVIGFIKGLFICFIISYLLSISIFKNGNDIKNGTFIKYSDELSNKAITIIIKNVNFDKINNEIEDFNAADARKAIESFFVKQGIIDGQ